MLLRKYHIVVFKDNEGACKTLRLRGWLFFALFGLFAVLVAANFHFFRYFNTYHNLKTNLDASEKTISEQNNQLLTLANKIKTLEGDLTRIRDFDSKLRVMINLDDQIDTNTSVGGSKNQDFSDSYLPVYRQELLARKMHNFIHQLNTDVQLEEVRQQELLHAFKGNLELLAATPSIWPCEGWVTSPFGPRISPFTGRSDFHQGLDVSNEVGTPVYSPAKGVVSFSGVEGGYGKTMVVKHGNGLVTRYAHLHSFDIEVGQTVERGQQIATVGNTGRSTGPHLHYEVRLNGTPVNPMRYILN